jgi:hypothetical protein
MNENPPATESLTPQQIESWRTVLLGLIGPAAHILPAEDIQHLRDHFQERLNAEESSSTET